MAKLVSPRAELAVLRGMCHKDKTVAGTLISSVDDTYFYSPESIEVYEAISGHMARTGEAPTYRLLVEDPHLSDQARDHLRNSQATIQTRAEAEKAVSMLNHFRQGRGFYNIAAHINEEFQKPKVDISRLAQEVGHAFNLVNSRKSTDESFLHLGRNNNTSKIVKSILYEDNSEDLIPTGIKAFDDVNGGLARGGLVTVAATSGGGKSTFTMNIGMNMARMGYKVLMVPLEMSHREMMCRAMAYTSKMNLTKIITQKMTQAEKDMVFRRHRLWEKKVKAAGGRFTVFKPSEDMTIDQLLSATAAYKYDAKIIDYISLLKGVDGDNAWQVLGGIARQCKINAENENCINILVAQLSDTGQIRYSRAITEHSSNSFTWVASKESKETGITPIEQPKSRNSQSYPFTVRIDYATMRVYDVSQTDVAALGTIEGEGKKSKDVSKVPNLASDL